MLKDEQRKGMEQRERLRTDIRMWGRRVVREVWRRHRRGERLPTEEARLARVLEDHPEFFEAWESGSEAGSGDPPLGEVNPFLHVQIHLLVEGQISAGKPREVGVAVKRLQESGMTRHEAIHEVGKVLTLEIHQAMKENRPLDGEDYVRSLREIPPGTEVKGESG